jgi:CheY-like chemotaxis protein
MREHKHRLRTALVADDDPDARARARLALGEGYAIVEARDGREALAAVARLPRPPDIAVLDLVMPGMSGVEALVLLKAAAPRTPVVALACDGPAQADLLEAAARLGADARLPKALVAHALGPLVERLASARPAPAEPG